MSPLAAYLLAAMVAWVPPSSQPEGADAAIERYEAIAIDVADDVTDPEEPPLFPGDDDRHLTGLELLAIASLESNFVARIDRGDCTYTECDGGQAFGLWQVHPEGGIELHGLVWRFERHGLHGKDLIADRRLLIRLVEHIVRGTHDPRYDGGARRERAASWAQGHPFSSAFEP